MKKILSIAVVAGYAAACSTVHNITHPEPKNTVEQAPPKAEAIATPLAVTPKPGASSSIYRQALKDPGMKIIVSRDAHSLWLMRDTTLLFRAPVAIGRDKPLVYNGKTYDFNTPVGKRKVIGKTAKPLWSPPEWHYFEKAQEENLQPVFLKKTSKVMLGDSTYIVVRDNQVGRINRFGNFWPFTPGVEIIFDGKIFVPPVGTPQRLLPDILGTHKLDMGNGFLLHGTNEENSIGEAVSHGCVRMYNQDVDQLYELTPVGTPVYIF